MNERIDQLAEECWVYTKEPLFSVKSPHWEFDRQKFAELILFECVKIAVFKGDADTGRAIRSHFGVE